MPTDFVAIAYATVLAAGGIFGFIKKGSLMSAAMGVATGALAGFGAYQTTKDPNNYLLSLAVAIGMSAFMGYRFSNSGKFMPAGLVAAISIAMVLRYGLRAAGFTGETQGARRH